MDQWPLPEAVDGMINIICQEQNQPLPALEARMQLSTLSEADALTILAKIRKRKIARSLSGYIIFMINQHKEDTSIPPLSSVTCSSVAANSGGYSSSSDKESVLSFVTVYGVLQRVLKLKQKRSRIINEGEAHSLLKRSIQLSNKRWFLMSHPHPHPHPLKESSFYQPLNVLDALETLEFWKMFLILSYRGGSKLEEVVPVDKIPSYKDLTSIDFERQIWNDFGRDCSKGQERINITSWGTEDRATYHCHVDPDGTYTFKGPFLEKTATLLQKTVGDENVMVVKFVKFLTWQNPVFNKLSEEGIFVGRKQYRFFVFKDGGKEEKMKDPTSSPVKCYFVCTEGFADLLGEPRKRLIDMPMKDARGIFMHIHKASSLSNYMARFSLILSKTVTLELNWSDVHVQIIDDIPCLDSDGNPIYHNGKPLIFTDGTGFISRDLALRCPHNCLYGRVVNNEETLQMSPEAFQFPHNFSVLKDNHSVPPLLIQFRMFHKGQAIKGTVLVNSQLPPNTIQVRKSMVKIPTDPTLSCSPTKDSFEIVNTSNKPKEASLSKNLIALLHYGGVPREFFLALLSEALDKPLNALYSTKAALKVLVNWDYDDEFVEAQMILVEIPLDEPFIQHRLSTIAKQEMKSLKAGKLPVSGSFYVMGTADPTGTLNDGEVCVIVDHGQFSGPVLVYRNPGLHPGDVHVVTARYVEAMKDTVGDSKYGIFFPSNGARAMADEMAGGDYDGDMYWVSTNPELLKHFRPSKPWKPKPLPPKVISEEPNLPPVKLLELRLFRLFVHTRFQRSNAMGIAAESWLSYMDRILSDDDVDETKPVVMQKINVLIDLYYDALDAPKKGKTVEVPWKLKPQTYPHHMGKGDDKSYKSTSILGQIHDIVDGFNAPVKVWKLTDFEVQIPEMYLTSWTKLYEHFRGDMLAALRGHNDGSKNRRATHVYQKYRKELYGGVDDPDTSDKSWKQIRLEALALYHVCYDYAILVDDPGKCGFAWKVAGDALCRIFLQSKNEKPLLCSPSAVRQIFR